MNDMHLYAIYDRVAMQFQAPFVAVNDGTAIRMFVANCKHPDLAYLCSDMDLYKVGKMTVDTGEIITDGKPDFLYRLSGNEVNDGD